MTPEKNEELWANSPVYLILCVSPQNVRNVIFIYINIINMYLKHYQNPTKL